MEKWFEKCFVYEDLLFLCIKGLLSNIFLFSGFECFIYTNQSYFRNDIKPYEVVLKLIRFFCINLKSQQGYYNRVITDLWPC